MKQARWKNIAIQVLWLLMGAGTIVLLGAAVRKKNQKPCTDIKIEIIGSEEHMFIDENDVMNHINGHSSINGKEISTINLRSIEETLEKNPWVENAELFFDNHQVLQIRIEERQPIARIITSQGTSFYLDSGSRRLPLSEKISAWVPVFTGFPSDKEVMASSDSALLKSVTVLGKYIIADSFWMAQVAQVNITPQGGFELIPTIGDHVVSIGNADDLDDKFNRLYTFYKKAWLQNGINIYEKIDVQYDNQVVAVKRGTSKAWADSAKARQLMQDMVQSGTMISDSLQAGSNANGREFKKDSAAVLSVTKPAVKPATNQKKNSVIKGSNNKMKRNTLSNVNQPNPSGKTTGPKAVMPRG